MGHISLYIYIVMQILYAPSIFYINSLNSLWPGDVHKVWQLGSPLSVAPLVNIFTRTVAFIKATPYSSTFLDPQGQI